VLTLKLPLKLRLEFPAKWMPIAILSVLWSVIASPAMAAEINVAASIRPVHSLVQMVLGDLGEAELMMTGQGSPHGGVMRPSERRALADADLVFIIDPGFETTYRKALPRDGRLVVLSEAEGVSLIEKRTETLFGHHEGGDHARHGHEDDKDDDNHHEDHEHRHEDKHDHDQIHGHVDGHGHDHGDELLDLHIWLDPENASAMLRMIRDRLAARYPEHREAFVLNADAALKELARLDDDLRALLSPVKGRGFITHHDAYAYLEKAYGLSSTAAIFDHDAAAADIGRIRALRHIIEVENVICLFHEPQFDNDIVLVLDPDGRLRKAELDPISADLPSGADFYPLMMRRLATTMSDCLDLQG
jgi:zinc transport system substrate-binding protein